MSALRRSLTGWPPAESASGGALPRFRLDKFSGGIPCLSLSQLAPNYKESPTLALNEAARLLRERGEPVIHLGIGEPKNKAPIAAILSSAAKLKTGDIKYAPSDGLPSLKKAVIRYTEENYGRQVAPENVIISTGDKQALYNLLFAITDPQDEIILLAPYWVSYPEMVRMVYGVPVIVTPEDGSFVPRFEESSARSAPTPGRSSSTARTTRPARFTRRS